MKATELMIGDWVKLMNPKGECIDYAKIDANLFGIFLRDGEEGFVRFEPIPLTSEILEKNGWKERKGYPNVYEYVIEYNHELYYNFNYHKLDDVIYEPITDIYDDNVIRNKDKSVHILQHALRLCGLDELADNFKV